MKTDIKALTDEQLRAVRDDRMAVTDDLYKLLDSTLDPLALRIALFSHMTKAITDAADELTDRIHKEIREFDARVAASKKETSQ